MKDKTRETEVRAVSIYKNQLDWIKTNNISLSPFLRDLLDKKIREQEGGEETKTKFDVDEYTKNKCVEMGEKFAYEFEAYKQAVQWETLTEENKMLEWKSFYDKKR